MRQDRPAAIALVPRRARRAASGRIVATLSAAVALGGIVAHEMPAHDPAPLRVVGPEATAPRPVALATMTAETGWMLDPAPSGAPGRFAPSLAVLAPLRTAVPVPVPPRNAPETPAASVPAGTPVRGAEVAEAVPLPLPRPAELRAPQIAPAPQRLAERASSRGVARVATVTTSNVDNASFFETLFGAGKPAEATGALAYAAPSAFPADPGPRRGATVPPSAGTAVYDISAQVVTLPSGERLEAHSGLGKHLDDPRFVHVRMRGATPPGTYDLTERESLFHGVRAIRLNPLGGSGAIHGRDGILAHTYMLGPNGDSNGCVSFRNYDRFLQAFLRGDVRRLVVVAGTRGQDGPTNVIDRLFGRRSQEARRLGEEDGRGRSGARRPAA